MSSNGLDVRIKEVLADVFGLESSEVGSHTSTDTVPEWTSLTHLVLVLGLEEEFNVSFDDDETVGVTTFDAIASAIRRKLGGAS